MPKLPFKRQSVDEPASLNSYIPTQMVDYTSLPPIDEETALMRFGKLPIAARIAAILLPLLLLAGTGWGVWVYLAPPPAPVEAHLPPPPQITSIKARVVSDDAITVEADVVNLTGEVPATVQLLANGTAVAWADSDKSSGAVKDGALLMRVTRAAENAAVLDPSATYTVELMIAAGDSPLTAQADLEVPTLLQSTFFAAPAPELTPEPTPSPSPQPTPEPIMEPVAPAGPPTLSVALDSSLLISPTLGTEQVASVAAGTTFEPLLRSADNQWFLIEQNQQVGWLPASAATMDAAARDQVALVTPDLAAVTAGPHTATVGNGGNIRYRPNVQTGTVLGQLHAGQTISLTAQTVDGAWFKVVAPEAEGWVSVTLLLIEDNVLSQVPVSK